MKNILVIAGPSAVGKTTAAHALLSKEPRFEFVRSVTTRERRGDMYDSEYIYIDKAEFEKLLAGGEILEYTEYAGAMYATPRFEIERIIKEGRVPLLILDLNGVVSVYKNSGDISPCQIYIYDDINVIKSRLYDRYMADGKGEEGKKKYRLRVSKNALDYERLPDVSDCFYALLENNSTVDSISDMILEVFLLFESGKPRNETEIKSIAKKLSFTK